MRVRKLVFVAILGVFLTLLVQNSALALRHLLDADSVDCTGGCGEIRWYGEIRWDEAQAHANKVWNDVGKINIARDNGYTIADLEWDTYRNDDSSAYDGFWRTRTGADLLSLNSAKLENYSQADRWRIATHEVGHALRIEDHPNDRSSSAYWRDRAIMYWNPKSTDFLRPSAHDRDDYYAAW